MGKRVGSTSATLATKRSKADPLVNKCEEVVASLKGAPDMPACVCELLSAVLPLAMSPQEERHKFQESVITTVATEMATVESVLQAAVSQAEEQVRSLGQEKEQQVAGVAKLDAELTDMMDVAKEKKCALAKDALDVRNSKEALAEAETKQNAGEAEIATAELSKTELKAAMEALEPLKQGIVEQGAVAKAAALVPQLRQLVTIEESLATVAPGALAKAPASRGPFEAMVVEQLAEQASKRLAALEALVESAMPAKAALDAAVGAAQAALAEARGRQRVSADAFVAAHSAEQQAESGLATASKALKAMGPRQRSAEKALQDAANRLEAFRAGPAVCFAELRTRTALVPEEEPRPVGCASEVAQADVAMSGLEVTAVA